jgi:hypothetical protein
MHPPNPGTKCILLILPPTFNKLQVLLSDGVGEKSPAVEVFLVDVQVLGMNSMTRQIRHQGQAKAPTLSRVDGCPVGGLPEHSRLYGDSRFFCTTGLST